MSLILGVLLRICLYSDHVINAQDGDGRLRRKLHRQQFRPLRVQALNCIRSYASALTAHANKHPLQCLIC